RDGQGLVIALVVSRFNSPTTEGLLSGALAELSQLGVDDDDITVVRVPGALELATAARFLAFGGEVDGVVILGAVIKGETDHYDFVCSQTTRSCVGLADESGVPVGFGLLTCETLAQASARSGDNEQNKGREAAATVVEMANLIDQLDPALEDEELTPEDLELLSQFTGDDFDDAQLSDGLEASGDGDSSAGQGTGAAQ
ncbi:MAG: 6,7-dimethyl-8-ribityllumazine synthase, partial [Pseudohongiellaceae bacterium]